MAKYRLLSGLHLEVRDGNLIEYKAGDIVESELELDKRFPNKFELVQAASEPAVKESRLEVLRRKTTTSVEG